ncbi:MAG: Fic family protein [Bacteroidales bacterium]|nr:Fic family protein [Bacteroidales bacterium]
MYLHKKNNWQNFRYNNDLIVSILGKIRLLQGILLGKSCRLGFNVQNEKYLETLSLEIIKSSEIEGESLNIQQVRSSLARRLGINAAGLVPSARYIDGIVEMNLDATRNYNQPLTDERLFGWHNVLFPTGRSGLYKIEVGRYRTREMEVVSEPMGMETVHYQAPSPDRVPEEMQKFLTWFNAGNDMDLVLKAAIAHFWFVTIHPFDDGNGRIARALTDMLLAKSEDSPLRFYSVSNEINADRNGYYSILEDTETGDGDITYWLQWFLESLRKSIDKSIVTIDKVLDKTDFFAKISSLAVNQRQKKILTMLLDGFDGKLTTAKYAKINKCSQDTALNDIKFLIENGILEKTADKGKNTGYQLLN